MANKLLTRPSYKGPSLDSANLLQSREDIEEYLDVLSAAHAATLHGSGVATGLAVFVDSLPSPRLGVACGSAVDGQGRAIILADDQEPGVVLAYDAADNELACQLGASHGKHVQIDVTQLHLADGLYALCIEHHCISSEPVDDIARYKYYPRLTLVSIGSLSGSVEVSVVLAVVKLSNNQVTELCEKKPSATRQGPALAAGALQLVRPVLLETGGAAEVTDQHFATLAAREGGGLRLATRPELRNGQVVEIAATEFLVGKDFQIKEVDGASTLTATSIKASNVTAGGATLGGVQLSGNRVTAKDGTFSSLNVGSVTLQDGAVLLGPVSLSATALRLGGGGISADSGTIGGVEINGGNVGAKNMTVGSGSIGSVTLSGGGVQAASGSIGYVTLSGGGVQAASGSIGGVTLSGGGVQAASSSIGGVTLNGGGVQAASGTFGNVTLSSGSLQLGATVTLSEAALKIPGTEVIAKSVKVGMVTLQDSGVQVGPVSLSTTALNLGGGSVTAGSGIFGNVTLSGTGVQAPGGTLGSVTLSGTGVQAPGGTIGGVQLGSGVVTAGSVSAGALSAGVGAITGGSGTIGGVQLGGGTVTATSISAGTGSVSGGSGTIGGVQLSSGAVSAAKVTANSLSVGTITLSGGGLSATSLQATSGDIGRVKLSNGTVNTGSVQASSGTIGNIELSGGSLNASSISAGSANISLTLSGNAITATTLAATEVTATRLTAGTGTVGGVGLGGGTIDAVKIRVGPEGERGGHIVFSRLGSSSSNHHYGYVGMLEGWGIGIGVTSAWDSDSGKSLLSLDPSDGALSLSSAYAEKPGGGAWAASSDIRLKTNVRPLRGVLDKLLKLRGAGFEWIDPAAHGNLTGPQVGFIAQEVEAVFPEWVGIDRAGFKMVSIRGFEALVVEALRELKAELEGLKRAFNTSGRQPSGPADAGDTSPPTTNRRELAKERPRAPATAKADRAVAATAVGPDDNLAPEGRLTIPAGFGQPVSVPVPRPIPYPDRKIVATYDYTDSEGKALFQIVRFFPKAFRTRMPDGAGGWTWGFDNRSWVIYRLPEVINASHVLIVEGEKDVETAYRLGLPKGWAATCSPFGAQQWRPSYSEYLCDKRVVICPDTDRNGLAHLRAVGLALAGKAAEVRVVLLSGGFKDLSEWAAQGASGKGQAEFWDLLRAARLADFPSP